MKMSFIRDLFSSSYFLSMAIRSLNAALSLGISVLLARLLGPAEYGVYGVILSFATILAIPFTAGLPGTLTRDIAKVRVSGDYGQIRLLIRFGTVVFIALIPIVFLIAVILWLSGYKLAGLPTGVLIAALLAPLMAADSNRIGVMKGLGSAIRSQIPDFLIRPLGTSIIVLVLLFTLGTASAVTGIIAYSSATIFGFTVGALMVRSDLKKVPHVPPRAPLNKRYLYSSIGTMSLLGGSNVVTGNIDLLLVSHFSDSADAGLYKVALAGLAIVLMGGNAITAVAFPRLAEAIPSQDLTKIAFYSDKALKGSAITTILVTLIIFLVGRPVIQFVYGVEYRNVWPILMILAVGYSIAFLMGQGPHIAALSGTQVLAAGSTILGIFTTVLIAYLLTPAMGTLGIAVGSMCGTIIRYILIAVVIRAKLKIDITFLGYLRRRL